MAIVLNNITSGYNISTINANFQKIEDYVNDKLLARADTGVAGEAMMGRDLDMNGHLILNVTTDPSLPGSLLTVGQADARYYNISGDTLTGPMNVNGQSITNVPTPTSSTNPATKGYVDGLTTNISTELAKAIRVPEASVQNTPTVEGRKGKLFAWNSEGQPIAVHSETDDGTQLEIDLAGADGFKYIGRASSLSALRSVEPSFAKQAIIVERAVTNGPEINKIFFYDDSDTTSLDDDYRIIVTTGGKRWVTDCEKGIDIRLGGLLADGSNFGTAANKIIAGEVKKIVDSNTSFIRAVQTILVPHPTYLSKNAYYTIDQAITIPSFMGFLGAGWIDLRTSLTTSPIIVRNQGFVGLTSAMGGYIHSQGFSTFRNFLGKFRLLGPGNTVSTGTGIEIGNTASGDFISVRDLYVRDVQVRNFYNGIGFNGFDTYIITIADCDIVQNNFNVAGLNINKSNSGERILFKSCTIGNSRSHNIYWNLVGWNVTFDNCSLDYCGGSTLVFASGGKGCLFRFTNGTFIEGFGTNLISQDVSGPFVYDGGRKNKVIFDTAYINAQGIAGEFSSRRQIIASSDPMLGHVDFINTDIRWPKDESQPQVALLGYTDATASYVRARFVNSNTPYDQSLTRYGDSLNAGLFRFSGTDGATFTTDATTGISASLTGGATVAYSSVDADGLTTLLLTATSTSDSFEFRNQNLRTPVCRFNQIYSAISVMMSGVTSGAVSFSTKLYYYGTPTFTSTFSGDTYSTTLSGSTYTTTRLTGSVSTSRALTLLGSATGTSMDVSALLSVPDTTLVATNYVGVQTFCEVGLQTPSTFVTASPTIRLTGFVGTLKIKLPAYWMPDGSKVNSLNA